MWKDEAVKFVDDREREARQRYEQLRAEMTGRAAAADVIRGGDAQSRCDSPGGISSN
jgi:hypothetical protein